MKKLIAALTLSLGLLLGGCGLLNFTPVQEELLMGLTPESEDSWVSSEELEKLLPGFAFVHPGVYKLVPRGLVSKLHKAPWCAPQVHPMMNPYNWDCQDYSYDVLESFDDLGDSYAVGVAWSSDHMVFLFVDTEETIILYEPQDCQFIRMEIEGICLGTDCLTYKRGTGE